PVLRGATEWSAFVNCSSVVPFPAPFEVATNASVGHASMHREHVPQRSGGGESAAIASDVTISPRKNHEPSGSLIRQVFFPIHPSPACRANLRSRIGAVSTQTL